jgi:hypothetical protein
MYDREPTIDQHTAKQELGMNIDGVFPEGSNITIAQEWTASRRHMIVPNRQLLSIVCARPTTGIVYGGRVVLQELSG